MSQPLPPPHGLPPPQTPGLQGTAPPVASGVATGIGSFRSLNFLFAIVVIAAGFGIVPAGYIGAARAHSGFGGPAYSAGEKIAAACWVGLGIVVVWRMVRCRVIMTADELVVVGFLRTHRLPWAQVDKVVLKFKSYEYFGGGAQSRVVRGDTSFMMLAASAGSWASRATSLQPLLDGLRSHGVEIEGL